LSGDDMLKKPHYLALGAVIVLTLVVLKLPDRTAAQLKLAISGLFLPLFGLTGSAGQLTEKAGNAVVPRRQLVEQLVQLQQENQQLRLASTRAEELQRENARLRQALGVNRDQPWRLKLARVVSRDPANWWRTVRIDAGLRDGVTPNCPVLTAEGLVGRVAEAGYAQSQVVLLGDPNCRVSVLIEETRDNGVIAPSSSSPLDNTIVDLGYLSRNSPLRAGQRVVTSGLGGIFPKGILVGHVLDWRQVGYGLYSEARARLAVDLNALEEVWVKLP
jgi:rod shape-determining protein MreC